jgi:hypothetical protein
MAATMAQMGRSTWLPVGGINQSRVALFVTLLYHCKIRKGKIFSERNYSFLRRRGNCPELPIVTNILLVFRIPILFCTMVKTTQRPEIVSFFTAPKYFCPLALKLFLSIVLFFSYTYIILFRQAPRGRLTLILTSETKYGSHNFKA